jgi:hypothetical protein
LNNFLANWREMLPVAGLILMAAIGIVVWLRRKPEDASEVERQRRAYLNKVGRIVEGQVLEISEHTPPAEKSKNSGGFAKRSAVTPTNGAQRLLYYTYSISGVTYETAQDVTGLEERLHLTRAAVGQTASVKYDPANPSNSILLADDWSGLH